MKLTSKQRAYLRSLAAKETALFQIGKNNLTPEVVQTVEEAFNNRELIKISILKNAVEDPKTMANALAERTKSTMVEIIGHKIVLYRPFKDEPEIVLPK
ncbi:MAG: ribosome assembly RNA-binding protein YhbY [Lachnospiraceae bacterium]|nr:ribosome assembly RNA-binding protein YhbY [Lachnospiraceae bacterium]